MKHIAHMRFVSVVAFARLALAATSAPAQTCSAPTEIVTAGIWQGNTCNNTRNLPYLANGAILNNGEDDVYHVVSGISTYQGYVTLSQMGNVDLSLFICRGPCGTYSTCIAAADTAVGTPATLEVPPGDYYIIVGHAGSSAPTCGSYQLGVFYPFPD